jgi:6-pyruvoyltetrahydropterin/6-carboxytetrahydropterin synthase
LDLLKNALRSWFDHTTVVAEDDPQIHMFETLHQRKLIRMKTLPAVGCEAFAHHAYTLAEYHVGRVYSHARVVSAECREHGANSAIYLPERTAFGAK